MTPKVSVVTAVYDGDALPARQGAAAMATRGLTS